MAAMSRDLDVAPHLGLIETEERGDIYQYVCNAVQEEINRIMCDRSHKFYGYAERWHNSGLMSRTLTKKPVMTRAYAATLYGIKEGVKDYVLGEEKADAFNELILECNWMGELIWNTMNKVISGPMAVMDYFQEVAKAIGKSGRAVEWITPSKNSCYYSPRKVKKKSLKISINRRQVSFAMQEPTEDVNARKLVSSIAPNIVHSFDASHLVLTTLKAYQEGVNDFAFVHDSFGTYFDGADLILKAAKEAWIDIYSENQLDRMYEEWCLLYPECDIPHWQEYIKMGELDAWGVENSDFFFA